MDTRNRLWYGEFHSKESNPGASKDGLLHGFVHPFTLTENRTLQYISERIRKVSACVWVMLSICTVTLSQDLEKIGKEKIISIKGGINASAGFFETGSSTTSDPMMYNLSGNLDINLLGIIDAPFSMYLGSRNKTFQQPSFRQFGLSPRYKNLTAHMGYRNLSFSPYTLSGMTFLGGGMEYAPKDGPFRIILMTGRLRKEISTSDGAYYNPPGYERWGCGVNVTAGGRDHQYGLAVFRAWDKVRKLIQQDSGFINPQENLVIGLSTSQSIAGKLTFSADYTISMITGNTYDEKGSEQRLLLPDFLIRTNASTRKAGALNLKAGTNINRTTLSLMYRRIDPGFESFGCTYLSNDLQEWLAELSTGLFGNKISFSGEMGVERNNLSRLQNSTTKRVIGSVNLNIAAGKDMTGSINYSNFSSSSNPGMVQLADSFRYIQTTRNVAGSLNYSFPGEARKSIAGVTFSLQNANTLNYFGTEKETDDNQFYSAALFMRTSFTNSKLSLIGNFNWNSFIMKEGKMRAAGPSITCGKTFLHDKMTVSANYGYILSRETGRNITIHSFRATCIFKAGKAGTINFYSALTHRKSNSQFSGMYYGPEIRTVISYAYSF